MYLEGNAFLPSTSGWSQKSFDAMRQTFFNNAKALVDQHDAGGDAVALANQLQNLLANFDNQSQQARAAIGSSYVDSRFHDYFDFFNGILQSWGAAMVPQVQAPAPSGTITLPPSVPSTIAPGFTSPPLVFTSPRASNPIPGSTPVGPSGGYMPSAQAAPAPGFFDSIPPVLLWGGVALLAYRALR